LVIINFQRKKLFWDFRVAYIDPLSHFITTSSNTDTKEASKMSIAEIHKYVHQSDHNDKLTCKYRDWILSHIEEGDLMENSCVKLKLDEIYNNGKKVRAYNTRQLHFLIIVENKRPDLIVAWDLFNLTALAFVSFHDEYRSKTRYNEWAKKNGKPLITL
jgi:hypothetical protein